jgi:uncharacterized radical SAM superfamily Fe-S cluster-containing enzyme
MMRYTQEFMVRYNSEGLLIPSRLEGQAFEKMVDSLCPVCLRVIEARIFLEGDAVMMEKCCEEHGKFRDVYWSDARLYFKFMRYHCDGDGIENPVPSEANCPYSCGLCSNHKTSTLLANIDLTDRCNLACPVCFADAGSKNNEPSFEQVKKMMQTLRDLRPTPCPAIQFSGGEPTLREDLPQIIAEAKRMGFNQIQIATNGLRIAHDKSFCGAMVKGGMNTVYLQFDGVSARPFEMLRGRNLLPIKLQAINNIRTMGVSSVVLVPTLSKGINDDQVGKIIRFAANNLDVVKGINVQPVSFTGRIDESERLKRRITIPDFLNLVEEQTEGEISKDDFYPVPFVATISRLISAMSDLSHPVFTVHPCCGAATYIFRNGQRLIPITRFLDVESMMDKIQEYIRDFDGSSLARLKIKGMILRDIPNLVDKKQAPPDLKVLKLLLRVFTNGTNEALTEFHNQTLFLGAMHFQDAYNIDLERIQRCGVHYATPDGKIIPFCSYNTVHRS